MNKSELPLEPAQEEKRSKHEEDNLKRDGEG